MKNDYEIDGDTITIHIYRKNGEHVKTLVSLEDLPLFLARGGSWGVVSSPNSCGYQVAACSAGGNGRQLLPHFLLNVSQVRIEHLNGDPLDNRRNNLQSVAKTERQKRGIDLNATKACSRCKEVLLLSGFSPDNTGNTRYGVMSRCKKCCNEVSKENAKTPKYKQAHTDWYQRKREARLKYSLENRKKRRAQSLVTAARNRAAKNGWDFDLDAHIDELQARIDEGRCEVSGIRFNLDGGRTYDSPSLDRIDSKKGYTYTNVRVVCWLINAACWTWGSDVLKTVMEQWFVNEMRNLRKKQREESMQFISYLPLLEAERAYCGASNLMVMLAKVGVNPTPYMLPIPYILSPDEVCIYADSMLNDLRDGREVPQDSEEVEYIKAVCKHLRNWGEKGYIIHVIA